VASTGVAAPLTCKLRVRYGECDPQGVVFNAHFLAYFDIAITELFRAALGGYQAIVDRGVDFVVAEAGLRYRQPAHFDEELRLEVAVTRSARHQEIQVLDWEHVNLDVGGGELAGDEAGRKPGGSWRLIFYVKPLWEMLREEWEAQGRPTCGKVCPPKAIRQSGLLALNTLQARVHKR